MLSIIMHCIYFFKDVPEDTLTLYSLEYLFGTMMTYVNSKFAGIPNPHLIASSELDKDAFSYSPNLECDVSKK